MTDADVIAAYTVGCDDALRREIDRSSGAPARLLLPLPRTPVEYQAMTGWLDALYRKYQQDIRVDFDTTEV